MKLILASQSPRRREILETLGLQFEIMVSDVDETSDERDPRALVEELSRRKGEAVWQTLEQTGRADGETVVISSDTVVSVDGKILGKPHDAEEARTMLRLLSGRTHEVVSGVCLIGRGRCGVSHEVTRVCFDELDGETINRYIRTCSPYDKAGAYAIQGVASAYIRGIEGCYFNVVGLPVHRMNTLYREIFGENLL